MKRYRLYFNSKADAPNCWSVDEGTISTEIQVASVELVGAQSVSRLNFNADNVREPRAWFEVDGTMFRDDNRVVIKGAACPVGQ